MSQKLIRILVVDDTFPIRHLARCALESAGYAVEVAASGKDAMDWYQQALCEAYPFDLLILDVAMPDMTGVMLVKKLREKHPDFATPFVFFTSHREPTSLSYAHSVAPLAIWDKTAMMGHLIEYVDRAVLTLGLREVGVGEAMSAETKAAH